MKNKLTRMLNAPDKEISKTYGANGVLSRLFRTILKDLNIGGIRFGAYLQAYILDGRHGVPANKKDQTSMRGNLTKEFARPQMTWKVFCKALRFLQLVRVEITLHAHHRNGKISVHHTEVYLGEKDEAYEFNEILEQSEEVEADGEPVGVLDFINDEEAAKKAEAQNVGSEVGQ